MTDQLEVKEVSIGEFRVRTEFNPSKDDTVSAIKQKAAELINLISQIPDGSDHCASIGRLKSLAMTEVESAAMWGVKAATA